MDISIVSGDGGFVARISRLIKLYFYCKVIGNINVSSYPTVVQNDIDLGQYCFFDTEISDVENVVDGIKKQHRHTKIVFVGECGSQKDIDLAIKGFELGVSGFILKTYSDEEIFDVLGYLFNPFYAPHGILS